MTEKICKYCGVYEDEHNREHLTTVCYPKRINKLNEILDSLNVQAIRDIVPGWVGIPTIEWDSNMQDFFDTLKE